VKLRCYVPQLKAVYDVDFVIGQHPEHEDGQPSSHHTSHTETTQPADVRQRHHRVCTKTM